MAKVQVLLHSGKIKKMSMQHARIFERLGKGIIYTPEIEDRPKVQVIEKTIEPFFEETIISEEDSVVEENKIEPEVVEEPKKRRGRPKKEESVE